MTIERSGYLRFHLVEPPQFAVDHAEHRIHLGHLLFWRKPSHQLDIAPQHGQRRAQLVRHQREEIRLELLGQFLGGHVAHHQDGAAERLGGVKQAGQARVQMQNRPCVQA